ncbi:hypothetical protein [uncultured Brevibacterium sp.]|uniref:hypothetical protein n=1 Tax=uncultured Brevibacterium sp. TaxID=189678 RepID=UPI0025D040B3|nr:hypothetical protein [uncultured Brevibacterium sp.]
MTQVLIATALWLAVVGLIILRGHGAADRSTINATASVGVGLSLNITPLYLTVDAWLGGHNLTDLIANVAIIFGISALARGVARASNEQMWLSKLVLGPRRTWLTVAITVAAISILAFSQIDMEGTSARFMIDYGDQPAAALYSGVQHVYFGAVTASLAIICAREASRVRGAKRLATIILMLGGAIQTLSCLDVLVMDASHVAANDRVLAAAQGVYDYVNAISFLLITAGFVLLPLGRLIDNRRHNKRSVHLLGTITPAWERAQDLEPLGARVEKSDDHGSALYRLVVEVRDVQATKGHDFTLTTDEAAALDEAERHLMGEHSSVRADA